MPNKNFGEFLAIFEIHFNAQINPQSSKSDQLQNSVIRNPLRTKVCMLYHWKEEIKIFRLQLVSSFLEIIC